MFWQVKLSKVVFKFGGYVILVDEVDHICRVNDLFHFPINTKLL